MADKTKKDQSPQEFILQGLKEDFEGTTHNLDFIIDGDCLKVIEEATDDEGYPPYSKTLMMTTGKPVNLLYPVSPHAADVLNQYIDREFGHPGGLGMGLSKAYAEYVNSRILSEPKFEPAYTEEEWALIDRACAITGYTRESFLRTSAKTFAESLIMEKELEMSLSELFEKRLRDHIKEELHVWQGEGDELSYILVGRTNALKGFNLIRDAISPYVADGTAVQFKIGELLDEHGEDYFEGIMYMSAVHETSWAKTDKHHSDFILNIESKLIPLEK